MLVYFPLLILEFLQLRLQCECQPTVEVKYQTNPQSVGRTCWTQWSVPHQVSEDNNRQSHQTGPALMVQ